MLNRDLQFTYRDFAQSVLAECDQNPKLADIPIQVRIPISNLIREKLQTIDKELKMSISMLKSEALVRSSQMAAKLAVWAFGDILQSAS